MCISRVSRSSACSSLVGVLLLSLSVTVFNQQANSSDPLLGTWNFNNEKSTSVAGVAPAKSNISVWERLPDGSFKNTQDVVSAQGVATHTEVITKFDGTDAVVKGAADPTTRTYRRLDSRTGSPIAWEYVVKVNGKITTTQRSITSADGKTRAILTSGLNAQGQPVSSFGIYEKR